MFFNCLTAQYEYLVEWCSLDEVRTSFFRSYRTPDSVEAPGELLPQRQDHCWPNLRWSWLHQWLIKYRESLHWASLPLPSLILLPKCLSLPLSFRVVSWVLGKKIYWPLKWNIIGAVPLGERRSSQKFTSMNNYWNWPLGRREITLLPRLIWNVRWLTLHWWKLSCFATPLTAEEGCSLSVIDRELEWGEGSFRNN